MNILKAKIDWNHGFMNEPDIHILVDKEPNYKALRYQENSGNYFAELDGFCDFFHYIQPGEGFGGREFEITLVDETTKVLRGPWSSRAGVMNRLFRPCVEVAYVATEAAWNRGYTFTHGAITLELAQKVVKDLGYHLVKVDETPASQFQNKDLSCEQLLEKTGDLRWVPSIDPHAVVKPTLTTAV